MSLYSGQSIRAFLDKLASREPVPGGGSAAAIAGAMGAHLALMAARISEKRMKSKEDAEKLAHLIEALEKLAPKIVQVIDEDPKIFKKLSRLYQKKAEKPALDRALADCFQVQASLAFLILMALAVNWELDGFLSGSIKSDLAVSRSLLRAAFEGAEVLCEVNLKYIQDPKRKADLSNELKKLRDEWSKKPNS